MKRLLQIEWTKLYPYRAFRVLLVLYLVSFLVLPYTLETIPLLRNFQQLFEFPSIWFTYYFGAMFLSIALAVIVITVTTNEYSNRTFRQHVIDGMSRRELWLGKVAMLLIMAALLTVLFAINGYAAGYTNAFIRDGSGAWDKAGYIPGFFLHALSIMALSFFLALLLRRTGLALFAFLAWIFPVEMILRGVLAAGFHDGGMVSDRLPIAAIYYHNAKVSDLLSNPSAIMDINAVIPSGLGPENMLVKAAWTLIFLGLSWWLIVRRDL